MNIDWRPATAADVQILAHMNQHLIEDETGDSAPDTTSLRFRLHGWLTRGEMRASLFLHESTEVAYALWQDRGNDAFVRHFFVSREYRRLGVGRRAMEILERDILPPRTIRLEVLHDNVRGREFWQSLGYVPFSLTLEKHRT